MSAVAAEPRVLVVGSVMLDLVSYADPLPKAGETVRGTAFRIGFGGKGANQALSAQRLGADVTFVARVGEDVFGDLSIENLVAQGIDVAAVKQLKGLATGVAPIWVQADGSNRIIVVPGANDALSAQMVREEMAGLCRPDCVVCQLEVPDAAVEEALRGGAALGAVTILNPAPARREAVALFPHAQWVVPNEHEFELLWGVPPCEEALVAAADAWGCGLIVTLGAEGAAAVADGQYLHCRPPDATVVDTTGAGDAFVGAVAYALALGRPLAAALEFGNACGALSTETHGTQTSLPTRAAVDNAIQLQRL